MKTQYTVANIEANGVQPSGTFYGTPRNGWIMDMIHFVDYAGYAQLVIPVEDATDLIVADWSQRTTEADVLHAVIQFKRATQFPRFTMKEGEDGDLSSSRSGLMRSKPSRRASGLPSPAASVSRKTLNRSTSARVTQSTLALPDISSNRSRSATAP